MITEFAQISAMAVHRVGNPHYEQILENSNELIRFSDETSEEHAIEFLLSKIETPGWFSFHMESQFSIYQMIREIFEKTENLLERSQEIAETLFRCFGDNGPTFSGGHLWVSKLSDVKLNEELIDVISINLTVDKTNFFQFNKTGTTPYLKSEQGYPTDKVDASLIIYNIDAEEGYNCKLFQKGTKSYEFWSYDFLKQVPIQESYHETKSFLDMAKNFVHGELGQNQEVGKADQAEILNNTISYFKEKENFDRSEFKEDVFAQQEHADSFDEFQSVYSEGTGINFDNGFDISDAAVKKQSRIFKSVLKLDKNFHVYIHGNRKMIERGTDQDGKKYYKLYYDSEK